MSDERRTADTPGWPAQSEMRTLPGESGNYIDLDVDMSHLGFDHECRSCGQKGTVSVFVLDAVATFVVSCTCGNGLTIKVPVPAIDGEAVGVWERTSGPTAAPEPT